MIQSLQQNLNQIAQICNQLAQNEHTNVSRLQQMQQAEQTASQQLQHCAQLCSQVAQQVQQLSTSPQYAGVGAGVGYGTMPTGMGIAGGSWSSRPISTSNMFAGTRSGYGTFETSRELQPTGQQAFNTNKDLNQ